MRWTRDSRLVSRSGRILRSIVLFSGLLVASAFGIYLVLAAYALLQGYPLFAAWPLALFGVPGTIAFIDHHLPSFLVNWAVVGWFSVFLLRHSSGPEHAEHTWMRPSSWWIWGALPVTVGLFLFHTGCIWLIPDQMRSYAILSALAGIVPFSDAAGHFNQNHLFTATGTFHPWVMRRPMAAAMRVALNWAGGHHAFVVLGLQAALLGFCTWVLSLAVLRRWGLFAAVCTVALVFSYARNMQATYLVHSLGVSWTCLAMALLIEAQYSKRHAALTLGIAAMTVALLIRMGAMFVLPALLLWFLWISRHGLRQVSQAGALGLLAVVLCWGAASGIAHVYAGEVNQQGANFAYTLAGLSLGTNWSDAQKRYQSELEGLSEAQAASKLYRISLRNMRERPEIFLRAMFDRAVAFVGTAPNFLSRGFGGHAFPLLFVLLPILACLSLLRTPGDSVVFWVLILLATVTSAAVVYPDEGPRVLAVGYVVIAVFLASGLQQGPFPPERTGSDPATVPSVRVAATTSVVLFGAILAGPSLAYHFPPERLLALRELQNSNGEYGRIVLGGESMLGVLVVPDGTPLPWNVPAMHRSTFTESIRISGVEGHYQRLVTPEPPPVPFAFVHPPSYGPSFIAPPKILTRKDVTFWRIEIDDWYTKPLNHYFRRIVKAEPFDPSSLQRVP